MTYPMGSSSLGTDCFFYSFAAKRERGEVVLTSASDTTVVDTLLLTVPQEFFSVGVIAMSALHRNTYNVVSTFHTLFHLIQFI